MVVCKLRWATTEMKKNRGEKYWFESRTRAELCTLNWQWMKKTTTSYNYFTDGNRSWVRWVWKTQIISRLIKIQWTSLRITNNMHFIFVMKILWHWNCQLRLYMSHMFFFCLDETIPLWNALPFNYNVKMKALSLSRCILFFMVFWRD